MWSIEQQQEIADTFYRNFRSVETYYLEKVANQLKQIGTLKSTEINRLEQIAIMNGNIQDVNKQLTIAVNASVEELDKVLLQAGSQQYADSLKYYKANGIKQIDYFDNKTIQALISAVAKETANTMANLSKSTIISKTYTKAIDDAVVAITTGLTDYNTAMAKVIREQATLGVQTQSVEYASGAVRRLDSAVRMNVMDAMHTVTMQVGLETGKEFGTDGVEITSHSNPAPDHLFIDGATMSNAQFETFQNTASRPIGQLNCYHRAIPVIIGVSVPNMTTEERAAKIIKSQEKHEYGGKEKTIYEWTQEQRRLETKIRYQNDVMKIADVMGADITYNQAKAQKSNLMNNYTNMSSKLNLEIEPTRLR
ncbi:MAG: phage minor capsid protein [Clostridia bacterium]